MGCSQKKKSILGYEISKSPQLHSINENDLLTLANSEDNYFILFCSSKDIVCKAIIEDTGELNLKRESSYYFFDIEDYIAACNNNNKETAEEAINDFISFMNKYTISRFPVIQYRKGDKFIKSHVIADKETSPENKKVEEFKEWMNTLE